MAISTRDEAIEAAKDAVRGVFEIDKQLEAFNELTTRRDGLVGSAKWYLTHPLLKGELTINDVLEMVKRDGEVTPTPPKKRATRKAAEPKPELEEVKALEPEAEEEASWVEETPVDLDPFSGTPTSGVPDPFAGASDPFGSPHD